MSVLFQEYRANKEKGVNSGKSAKNKHTVSQRKSTTGVLVAISIPIFTSQLEKAKESTDLANARSAYAALVAACMTEDDAPTSTDKITYSRDGDKGAYVYKAVVKMTQGQDGWKTADADKAVAGITSTGSVTAGGSCTITVTEGSNEVTVVYA